MKPSEIKDRERIERAIERMLCRYESLQDMFLDAENEYEAIKGSDNIEDILTEGERYAEMECLQVEAKFLAEYLTILGVSIAHG